MIRKATHPDDTLEERLQDTIDGIRDYERNMRRQLLFLYILLVVAFVALAVRTEVNTNSNEANTRAIQQGLYETCMRSQARTQEINPGRNALVTLLTNLVDSDPTLTAEEKSSAVRVLKEGLVVPPVNCGNAP